MKRLVLVLAACSSKSPSFDKLHVTVDGKPLAIDRAFMKVASPDVYTFVLGAGKGSCTEDGTLAFTVTKRLAPSGAESFAITDLWSRDVDVPKLTAPVQLANTKLTIPPVDGKLAMRGELDAVRCPEAAPTGMGMPKGKHASKAAMTIAGKVIDVHGVTVSKRGEATDITISSSPKDCSGVTLPAAVILERVDTKWSLRGTAIEHPVEAADAALTFSANGVGKSVDGATLILQLSGSAKLGDYTVKLDGTAEAIECVR